MTHIVLVHGAWHGSWCWSAVTERLRPLGHTVTAVDLHRGTLAKDTRAVQDASDANGTDAIVCGHSYGGAVITGLRPELIRHAVYLAALMPDAGQSITALNNEDGRTLSDWVELREDGASCVVAPDAAKGVFFGDCGAAVQDEAVSRSVPQLTKTLQDPPGRALWRGVPATYVICTEDKAFPPERQQRMSRKATYAQSWPTSHSPFLSAPERVADLLAELARQPRGPSPYATAPPVRPLGRLPYVRGSTQTGDPQSFESQTGHPPSGDRPLPDEGLSRHQNG